MCLFFLNQLQEFKMGLIGRSLLLMITIIVLFEGCSLFSEEENKTAFSSDAISSLDSIIKRNGILGGTIIAFNDTVLKQYSFGIAKLEQNIQWSDTTYFRIASISKFITTIAILQLIEQGSFSSIQTFLHFCRYDLEIRHFLIFQSPYVCS